jgi:hypothetical protein
VLLAHVNPTLEYTSSVTSYAGQSELDDCAEAIVQGVVDETRAQVWFVVASFHNASSNEVKGVDFGLGSYSSSAIILSDYGHCFDRWTEPLAITTDGWPGPNEGIAIVSTGGLMNREVLEVYWFAAYVYSAVTIPLDVNPTTAVAAVLGEVGTQELFDDLGSIGFGQPGYNPCNTGPGDPTGACCLWDDSCEILTEEECSSEGGLYRGDYSGCLPNPCDRPAIETTWGVLKKIYED